MLIGLDGMNEHAFRKALSGASGLKTKLKKESEINNICFEQTLPLLICLDNTTLVFENKYTVR